MDLYVNFPYSGKLKLKGLRYFEGLHEGHDYVTSRAFIKPKRNLQLFADDFYCRDELLPGITWNLYHFVEANRVARLEPPTRSDRFEIVNNYPVDADAPVAKYLEWLRVAIMGQTNEEFGFGASPYLVRYAVGRGREYGDLSKEKRQGIADLNGQSTLEEIRTALGWRDWFWNVMVKADEQGIRLNTNMIEAWGLKRDIEYGHMGLEMLKIQGQSRLASQFRDYVAWFPPIALRKKS